MSTQGTTTNVTGTGVGTELEPEPEPTKEPEAAPNDDFDIAHNIDPKNIDIKEVVKNIWTFLSTYTPDDHMPGNRLWTRWTKEIMYHILDKGLEQLKTEPAVLKIEGECTVFGPIYGQGDSLVALISAVGMVPDKQFLFLGGYMGLGFAPVDTFMMILALKVLFPKRVWMLRGHHEERSVMVDLSLKDAIQDCDFKSSEAKRMVLTFERVFAELPIAAILPHDIWAMNGGPGPSIQLTSNMPKINEITKATRKDRPMTESAVMFETVWSCLKYKKDAAIALGPSPMPSFDEDEVKEWMKTMGIGVLIRGRQLVHEGVVEYPEGVFTISSAACYLDQFSNMAGAMTIRGRKMLIHRIRITDPVAKTLDYAKAGVGRNVIHVENGS